MDNFLGQGDIDLFDSTVLALAELGQETVGIVEVTAAGAEKGKRCEKDGDTKVFHGRFDEWLFYIDALNCLILSGLLLVVCQMSMKRGSRENIA